MKKTSSPHSIVNSRSRDTTTKEHSEKRRLIFAGGSENDHTTSYGLSAKSLNFSSQQYFALDQRQQRQSWRLDDKERNLTFCDYPNSSHSSSLCSWDANLTNKKIPISSIRGIIFGTDLTTYLIQHPSVKVSEAKGQN